MRLEGKIILIIGGANGIGRATAELCVERGARVIIADFDEAAGRQTAAAIPNTAFVPVNVADEASVAALAAEVGQSFGRLDALVQTAGVLLGAYVPLDELPLEAWRRVHDINVIGTFLCVKHVVPLIQKTGQGVVILLSSGAATNGSSSLAYGASKAAVNGFALTLAKRLQPDNIRVNVVSPGNIDTAMKRSVIQAEAARLGQPEQAEAMIDSAALGEPAGVARVLAWLVSDEADYVRGLVETR